MDLSTLHGFIVNGIQTEIQFLEFPVFTWNAVDYNCVPSVNQFERDLADGGFALVKVLNLTVPMTDENLNSLFTILPSAQDIITYKTETYRVISVHTHPSGTYFRLIAHELTRGV